MSYKDKEDKKKWAREYYHRKKLDPEWMARKRKFATATRKKYPEKNKEYKQKYNSEHPDRKKKYEKIANRNRRINTIKLLGGKCIRCGNSDFRVLQIDHVNGNGNEERRKVAYMRSFILQQLKSNPVEANKKYQLLCANCNWIKFWERKEWYVNG